MSITAIGFEYTGEGLACTAATGGGTGTEDATAARTEGAGDAGTVKTAAGARTEAAREAGAAAGTTGE